MFCCEDEDGDEDENERLWFRDAAAAAVVVVVSGFRSTRSAGCAKLGMMMMMMAERKMSDRDRGSMMQTVRILSYLRNGDGLDWNGSAVKLGM